MKPLLKLFTDILKNKQVKVNEAKARDVHGKIIKGEIKDQVGFWKAMGTAFTDGLQQKSGISVLKDLAINKIKFAKEQSAINDFIKDNFTIGEANRIKEQADFIKILDAKYKRIYDLRTKKMDELQDNVKQATEYKSKIKDDVLLLDPENFNKKSLQQKMRLFEEAKEEYQKVNTKGKRKEYAIDNISDFQSESEKYKNGKLDDEKDLNEKTDLSQDMLSENAFNKQVAEITKRLGLNKAQQERFRNNFFNPDESRRNSYSAKETLKDIKKALKEKKAKQNIINNMLVNGGWKKAVTGINKKAVNTIVSVQKAQAKVHGNKKKKATQQQKNRKKAVKKAFKKTWK